MKGINLIALAIIILLVPGALAQVGREEVELAFNISNEHLQEMAGAGFSVARVKDTLAEARQLFNAQSALEESGGTPDYGLVMEKIEGIERIKRQAFETYDEIEALELTIKETEGINKTAVEIILNRARKEFQDERYEKAGEFIENAYQVMSEEQAFSTRVAIFFEAARRNIVGFFMANWVMITSAAIGAAVFFILFHNEISKFRIKRKMRKLDIRKGVLNNMVKRLQHEYFEAGRVSEGSYNIKMEKFRELLRDIERRKPLLREELESRRSIISRFRKQS